MKKLSYYTLSAAAVMIVTAATPLTSMAAGFPSGISCGNGNGIVIGGGNQSGQWGQNNGQAFRQPAEIYRWGSPTSGITYGESILPDNNAPDENLPDISLPEPELPAPDGPMDPDGGITPENPDRPNPENPGKPDEEIPGGSVQDEYADAVVDIVNQERAKAGLAPLTVDVSAAAAAQVRAQEIKSSFSHTRPSGQGFSSALTESGASFKGAGENIAYGQNSPEAVMQTWMNSSGHRANILNSNYTSIGVGHYRDANGTDYWTQLFIY